MEQTSKILTQMSEDFGGKLNGLKNIRIPPLRKIPEPPPDYISWIRMTLGIRDDVEAINKKRRQLNKESEGASEIIRTYCRKLEGINAHNTEWAEMALAVMSLEEISFSGEGIIPIMRIETREADKRKHGEVEWMLITGFEFWEDGNQSKRRFLSHRLYPEWKRYDILKVLIEDNKREVSTLSHVKNGKMAAAGDWEENKKYPSTWDQEEPAVSDF